MDPVSLYESESSLWSVSASGALLDPSSMQDASSSVGTAPHGEPRTPSSPPIPFESVNAEAAKVIYKPLGPTEIRLVKIHPGAQFSCGKDAGDLLSGVETLVWLGNQDDPLVMVLFAMFSIGLNEEALNRHMKNLEKGVLDGILHAFYKIRNLDYWMRVWVSQEIMYSRDVSILYSSLSATYSGLTAFWNAAQVHLNVLKGDGGQIHDTADAIVRLKIEGPNALPRPRAAQAEEFMTLEEWRQTVELKECTDPRDMVFAYYGCFHPDVRRRIVIDYSKSLEDILVGTMRVLIEDSDCLDVILDTPDDRTGPPLPSWVPRVRKGEFSKFIKHFSECKAHGDISPVCTFLDGDKILQVVEVCIGVVQAVARPFREDETIPAMRSWMQSESLYLDFMTYLFDIRESLDVPLQGGLLDCYVAAFVAHAGEHPEVLYYLLKGCLDEGFDPSKWPFKPEWVTPLWQLCFTHFGRRIFSFVGTETLDKVGHGDKSRSVLGYCLGAKVLAEGDKVCVIAGCSVPAILRPLGHHYIVLGDAYVPCFMFGEAMSGIGDGTREPEAFSLC